MSTSTTTPRRSLARPRPSLTHTAITTASSPNLSAAYNTLQAAASLSGNYRGNGLLRKSSLSALTSHSLSTIPDASDHYALSTVMHEGTYPSAKMPPYTPSHGQDGGDLEVGDLVDVPGSMHGTVKFVGNVQGKKGTFAGVELSEQFASRGKNNGDVDG